MPDTWDSEQYCPLITGLTDVSEVGWMIFL